MATTARFLSDALLAPRERYSYGPSRQQRAELLVPDGAGPFPVAVAIHGGYWGATYGKWVMRNVARDLVRRGHAVWNVEYRRLGRGQGGGWPATFDDTGAAVDHLATLADPRLDLDDVVLLGHSAGGQLALFAASRADGDARVRVRRVVAQAPLTDMTTSEVAHRLLGGTPDQVPERYAAVNPIQLVPAPVPVLLVHGADDATVPLARSRRYLEAARAAGGDVELVVPTPGGHRDHIDARSPAWRVAADWISG